MYQLDATDRRILAALDDDPRMTVMLLAQRTGLARGTIQSRLDRYRTEGLLRLESTRIPPAALGRGLAGQVAAELDQHKLDEAVAAVRRVPEVLECFAPAGITDLLCHVVARDPDDLYRVSEEIRLCPGILRTQTSVFLREVIPYRIRPLLDAADAPDHAIATADARGRSPGSAQRAATRPGATPAPTRRSPRAPGASA
ncbi:Lrp/AsnC family transcriptional regulator [Piscicoccus intestinalis]|uniref:Lrp/AsnC family transcriptional regulator n=1 Tax=Piscicoccus intestinalis TaxID=746033 RepID=UPI000A04079F|nr:Lrp/AsnC family transcriptional regulator [Piscicoccus intestinalis]